MAAAYGWPEIVDLLRDAGAEPRSIIEAAGCGDLSGWELGALSDFERACGLRAAAVNERLDAIDALLEAGTPVDARVDGRPAIHWARRQGRRRAVAHLSAKGARADLLALPAPRAFPGKAAGEGAGAPGGRFATLRATVLE